MHRPDSALPLMTAILATLGLGQGCPSVEVLSTNPPSSDETPAVEEEQEPGGTLVVPYLDFVDQTAGLIGGIELPGGEDAWIIGEKDASGLILKVKAIVGRDAQGNFHEFYFDEQGLPSEIRSNGQRWTITYSAYLTDSLPRWATITHQDQSTTVELPPEFAHLAVMLQEGASSEAAARGFNLTTGLGVLQLGLGMAGMVSVAAAGTPVAAGVAVLFFTGSVASGCYSIGTSLMDRPLTRSEENVGLAISVVNAAAGISAIGQMTLAGTWQATRLEEKIGVVGFLVDTATTVQSGALPELQAALKRGARPADPKGLNGCWDLIMVDDGGNALDHGRRFLCSILNDQLTAVWQYGASGRVKQEVRFGADMAFDGVLISDMHPTVSFDPASGHYTITCFYGIFAQPSQGNPVRTADHFMTLSGSLEQSWNGYGQMEWTGKTSGTFSFGENTYLDGATSSSVRGSYSGQRGACPGVTTDPSILISGPEPLYSYPGPTFIDGAWSSPPTFTASILNVQEEVNWNWSLLTFLPHSYEQASGNQYFIAPLGEGVMKLWVTADVGGLKYHRLHEVTVLDKEVKVSMQGPAKAWFGQTLTYTAVIHRGDTSRLKTSWGYDSYVFEFIRASDDGTECVLKCITESPGPGVSTISFSAGDDHVDGYGDDTFLDVIINE